MEIAALIEELTSIPALSGHEDRMIARMRAAFETYADEVRVDKIGNVIATIHGEQDEPALLLYAHMDELGLVVRKIEEDGFLRFERVGGIPEKSLLGTWVEVHTDVGERVVGLVGTTSHHVTPPDRKFVVPSRLDMYIDVGCRSAEEVRRMGIQVGDAVTYRHSFARLGEDGLASKSLDNRVGCALLIQTLAALAEERPRSKVYLAATVQEEFNVRGVWPVVLATRPDAAICFDVTIATDTPDTSHLADMRMGHGPAVGLLEFHGRGTLGGLISNPILRRYVERVAAEEDIALQREVLIGIITDASFSQLLTEEGVPTASVSVPVRYTHAPVEFCSLRDVEEARRLLIAVARRFDASLDFTRG